MLFFFNFFFLILYTQSAILSAKKFEENYKFCINTSASRLKDEEKSRGEKSDLCEIVVTTLTIDEKGNFSNTVCKAHGASAYSNDLYYYLKFNNGDMKGRGTHHDICNSINSLLLAWMPYHLVEQFYAQELDPKESYINYIAKGTDREQNKSELCHFRHSDIVNHISSNLFTCVVMVHEDNFYDLGDNINVLIEIQPLSYELRNVSFSPWINSTQSYKTLLGKTTLKNYSRDRKYIYGSLNYTYEEKLELNLSTIYGEDMLELPLFFEHKNLMLELDELGASGTDVKEKAFFGRKAEPRSNIDVNVIGQWSENHRKFKADIYEYYGSGIRRFKKELNDGDITFTRIENAEPVFEMPTENDLVESSVFAQKGKPMERIIAEEDTFKKENTSSTEYDSNDDEEELPAWVVDDKIVDREDYDDESYSDLYPWFVLGILVVGGVILAIIIGILHVCTKKEPRQKYKFTGMKTPQECIQPMPTLSGQSSIDTVHSLSETNLENTLNATLRSG